MTVMVLVMSMEVSRQHWPTKPSCHKEIGSGLLRELLPNDNIMQ